MRISDWSSDVCSSDLKKEHQMRYKLCIWAGLAVASITMPAQSANITLDIFASSAPNVFGSPSWNAYAANALNSLENGLGTTGDRNITPTAYEVLADYFDPGDVMVTSFNSWRGTANPAVPFDNEYGNRIHFGLHAFGDGGAGSTRFRLSDLSFYINSSDAVLNFSGNFSAYNFDGTTRYGIDWGADRVKGGGDDTLITGPGSGMVLIDELVYVGVGNAYWPQDIAEMADTTAYIYDEDLTITGGYMISDGTTFGFSDDTTIVVRSSPPPSSDDVPEPGTLTLLTAGLGGLLIASRRRSKMSIA